jgi:hypothetical protein
VSDLQRELVERIRGEIPDLERVTQRVLRAWPHACRSSDVQNVYLDSVALNLHSFYSGLERLFELIARHLDRTLPAGDIWHRDLLTQMSRDLAHVRPAVISEDTAHRLDEYRRFRHLVRNVYTVNLAPEKMAGLITALPMLWGDLQAELLAFADFLEDLSQVREPL